MLGGRLRREERHMFRTRVCVDRVGAVNYLSEGVVRPPYPYSGTIRIAHEHILGGLDYVRTTCMVDQRPRAADFDDAFMHGSL
jgi:hypothetical protein